MDLYSKRFSNPTARHCQTGRTISDLVGSYQYSENAHGEANSSQGLVPGAYQVARHLAATKCISKTFGKWARCCGS